MGIIFRKKSDVTIIMSMDEMRVNSHIGVAFTRF